MAVVRERERLASIDSDDGYYYQNRLGHLEGCLCLAQKECRDAHICLLHYKRKCKSETLAQRLRLQGFESAYRFALSKKNRLEQELAETLAFSKSMV